jgi:uncharacterized membrane protein
MSERLLSPLTLLAAVGCGLNGGVFFAFSAFVMPALARLPPARGLAAMQSINVAAVTPPFMTAFLGTAAGCAVLLVAALRRWGQPGAAWLLTGCLLYLAGIVGITAARNVPLSDALAAAADGPAGAALWERYLPTWTAWNSLRAAAGLAAAAALTLARAAD